MIPDEQLDALEVRCAGYRMPALPIGSTVRVDVDALQLHDLIAEVRRGRKIEASVRGIANEMVKATEFESAHQSPDYNCGLARESELGEQIIAAIDDPTIG